MQTAQKSPPHYVHDPKWATGVSRLIKAHMAATGITYADLSAKLKNLGTSQSPENLRVKINRGNFGAQLFVQLLIVMGKTEINLKELELIVDNVDL
ncbi:MAG: hypothetical protein GKR92_03750 [Gammaproteobacteria bacterium]|nr:MAG: hypothetical protein GKR92_03750 [Gammaproteobacteria bacterium]